MVKRRLNRKPSGEGVPEFEFFTKARESKGMSVEEAAELLNLSPKGYAFCERWPSCMELGDSMVLSKALGIEPSELSDALGEYFDKLRRLGFES